MSKRPESVKLVNYPKLIFVWPLIVAPGLMMLLESLGATSAFLGWAYLIIIGLVLVTLGVDLDRPTAFVLGLIAVSLVLIGQVLKTEYAVNIFGTLFFFFTSLDVRYEPGLAIALSCILLVLFVWMFFLARVKNRWEITPFEFKHSSFGVVDHSLARGAKAIKTSYPDLLEVLFGLCGTLHVYSANGDKELMKIENVPLLPFVKNKISKVLLSAQPSASAKADEEENS